MSQSGYQKELKGYSGCKIFIVENADARFVRKFSSDEKYNERLQAQCTKQAQCSFAKVPKVLNSGTLNGLFYFDMEYMRGKLLSEHLLQVPASEYPQQLVPMRYRMRQTKTQADRVSE